MTITRSIQQPAEHYYRQYNSTGIYKLTNGGSSWSTIASVPTANFQCCGALEYFPDQGRLIFIDGDWGGWSYNPGTNSWTHLFRTVGNDGSGLPQYPMASYTNFAEYSKLGFLVFGGGQSIYKMNSSGAVSSIASAPFGNVNAGSGSTCCSIAADPVTGDIVVIDGSRLVWKLNPSSGTWTNTGIVAPAFFSQNVGVGESLISAPISDYGVIMYVKCDDASSCKVYLYKHAAGSGSTPLPSPTTPPPDAQAPTAPTNPTASAASSSQITLSWTGSTDNVGVTGYSVERCQGSGCSNFAQITTSPGTTFTDAGLSASTSYSYRVRATDAAGNLSGYSTVASATTQAVSTPVGGGGTAPVGGGGTATADQDFVQRCGSPGVIKCVTFDSSSDLAGSYGNPFGILPGTSTTPGLDSTVKASGNSSLKFTIPSQSGGNAGGAYFTNFSNDLLTQFGENSDFYIQWRQRFSPEMVSIIFQAAGGGRASWKQSIIGTGDQTGCTTSSGSPPCYTSCTDLEVTTTNNTWDQFPVMYNSCSGSASHGPYDGFYQPFSSPWNGANFKLQNGMPSPYCLYDNQGSSRLPPTGNCFPYVANEWMTFQVHIRTGPRVNNEFANSHVDLWVAREGQAAQQVINWGPYNLTAGASGNQKFGKVWLLPYMTNKDATQAHATAYTWYDELIISTSKIPDPNSGGTSTGTQAPAAPTGLTLK